MATKRPPRMDRVNQVVQEVLGDELELIDDPRLELVTVTGVRVEPGLSHAPGRHRPPASAPRHPTTVLRSGSG